MSTEVTLAINSAVSGLADSIVGLVTTNLPLIIGVVAAFIGIGLAKRFLRTLAG